MAPAETSVQVVAVVGLFVAAATLLSWSLVAFRCLSALARCFSLEVVAILRGLRTFWCATAAPGLEEKVRWHISQARVNRFQTTTRLCRLCVWPGLGVLFCHDALAMLRGDVGALGSKGNAAELFARCLLYWGPVYLSVVHFCPRPLLVVSMYLFYCSWAVTVVALVCFSPSYPVKLLSLGFRAVLSATMLDGRLALSIEVPACIAMVGLYSIGSARAQVLLGWHMFTIGELVFTILLERLYTTQTRLKLRSEASERVQAQAERLLSGMCDAVVRVSDDNYGILEDCPSLASLLLHKSTTSMKGIVFTDLMPPLTGDREAFESFLERPKDSSTQMIVTTLKDMASHTVCVQLFHVACVDADAQPAHIIGIRDAGEQRFSGTDTGSSCDSVTEITSVYQRTTQSDSPVNLEDISPWCSPWHHTAASGCDLDFNGHLDAYIRLTCDGAFRIVDWSAPFLSSAMLGADLLSGQDFLELLDSGDQMRIQRCFHETAEAFWAISVTSPENSAATHGPLRPVNSDAQRSVTSFLLRPKSGTRIQVIARISIEVLKATGCRTSADLELICIAVIDAQEVTPEDSAQRRSLQHLAGLMKMKQGELLEL
mmetsp:Transcript_41263/g.94958  ORF Transcript_41263/g.94958 Transcript_41263/m.94958 type:complete len:600 (+) Transcript_41263:59-1858(+)